MADATCKSNQIVRKRLAKLMARDCFRNSTKLEDMQTADQIDDQEMQDLMIDVVDRCYDFLMELCSPHCAEIIEDLKRCTHHRGLHRGKHLGYALQ